MARPYRYPLNNQNNKMKPKAISILFIMSGALDSLILRLHGWTPIKSGKWERMDYHPSGNVYFSRHSKLGAMEGIRRERELSNALHANK